MSLPWLFLLYLALSLTLSTEHSTKGFETTDTVTALGNDSVSTKAYHDRSTTPSPGKLVHTNDSHSQLIATEEYETGQDILRQEETTAKTYGLESLTFSPTQRDFDSDHVPTPESNSDMCIINRVQQQQQSMESENQTNSNTTTCKFFEGELVSSSIVATARFVIQDVVIPTIAFPGCILNVISVYVMIKQGTESSSTRYLIALGVADFCYLLTILLNWILVLLKEYHYVFYISARLFFIYAPLKNYFVVLTGRYSNLLVLLLSLDRFIAVKFPLKAKTSPLSRHPVKFAIALFIFLTVLLIPIFFRAEFAQMIQFDTNTSELVFKNESFSHSNPQFFTIHAFISVVFFRFSPVLFTFILNIAIILVMKFSNDSRVTTHMTDEKRQQRELKITRMLVTISLIFLMCVTPGLLHVIVANFYPAYSAIGTYRNTYLVLSYMFPVLDAINSTVNFFVYVLLSERFRVILLETFCHRFSRDATMQTAVTDP